MEVQENNETGKTSIVAEMIVRNKEIIIGLGLILLPMVIGLAALAYDSISDSIHENALERRRIAIEEALSQRDFDKARVYALKCSGDEQRKFMLKINKANIAYLIDVENDWSAAESIARELNDEEAFYEIFLSKMRNLLQQGNIGVVSNVLSSWIPTHVYKDQFLGIPEEDITKKKYTNDTYNEEVSKINDAVDYVLSTAIADENKRLIRQSLTWYKPIAVVSDKKSHGIFEKTYDVIYELQDIAKERARAKIKEAGINL